MRYPANREGFTPFLRWRCLRILTVLATVVSRNVVLGKEPYDCTPPGRPNLKCTILADKSCSYKPDDLYAVDKVGENPPPPSSSSLNVHFYTSLYKGKQYAGLNVSFKAPGHAGFLFVKGFEVKLTIMSGSYAGDTVCERFDLRAANITGQDVINPPLFFYDGREYLRQNTQYLLELKSLPLRSTTNNRDDHPYTYFNTPAAKAQVNGPDNSANWAFFVETMFTDKRLAVRFQSAPSEYKFTLYIIKVIRIFDNGTTKNQGKVNTTESSYFFKDLILHPGVYEVWVEPESQNKDCPCKNDGACEICMSSRSSPINITSGINYIAPNPPTVPNPTTPTPTSTSDSTPSEGSTSDSTQSEGSTSEKLTPPPRDDTLVLAISIPLSIVFVVILVLFIVYHRRCTSNQKYCLLPQKKPPLDRDAVTPSTPDTPVSEQPTVLTLLPSPTRLPCVNPEVTEKSILLVYHIDNPLHKNAVFLLTNFLEEHCSMKVYLYDRCTLEIQRTGTDKWVVEKMAMVDWIVILNSKGAYEKFKDPKSMKPIQTDSHILVDMFMCAMNMLECHHDIYTNKIISVYFPYTDSKHLIRQFTPKGIHYKLMDDIESFFLHVQCCEKYHQKDVIDAAVANRKEYHLTESGRKLKELISRMMTGQSGDFLATGVEADADHQNFDSGLESGNMSGFMNPLPNMWDGDRGLQTEFRDTEEEDSSFSLSLKDPDAWSNDSIGSVARAQIKEFDMMYGEHPSNDFYDASHPDKYHDGLHFDIDC